MKNAKSRPAPTAEQKEAAAARRAGIRSMFAKISALPIEKRILLAHQYGIRTAGEGHELSPANQLLLVMQCPTVSVVGGFEQWRNAGRVVRKGSKALAIWVPIKGKETADGKEEPRFILGNVFDISQTNDAATGAEYAPPVAVLGRSVLDDAKLIEYGADPAALALPAPGESTAGHLAA